MNQKTRENIFHIYRGLIRQAKRLKEPKRSQTINLVRSEFRNSSKEVDKESIKKMLDKAHSSLSKY